MSMAWKTLPALSQDTLLQARITDMGSHLQEFLLQVKWKKYEPMASWSTRYRNEYSKDKTSIARQQRAESTDDHTSATFLFLTRGTAMGLVRERSRRSDGMGRQFGCKFQHMVQLELEFLEDKLGQLMEWNTNTAY